MDFSLQKVNAYVQNLQRIQNKLRAALIANLHSLDNGNFDVIAKESSRSISGEVSGEVSGEISSEISGESSNGEGWDEYSDVQGAETNTVSMCGG